MSERLQAGTSFFAITPSDTVNLAKRCRSVYVGGAGNIAAVDDAGTAVTFSAVPVGTVLPIEAKRINATGTTATLLVALT